MVAALSLAALLALGWPSGPPDEAYTLPTACLGQPCVVSLWLGIFKDGFESGDTSAWGTQWWEVRRACCPEWCVTVYTPAWMDAARGTGDQYAETCREAAT